MKEMKEKWMKEREKKKRKIEGEITVKDVEKQYSMGKRKIEAKTGEGEHFYVT